MSERQELSKRIREYCKDFCYDGDLKEVNLCPVTGCPLWDYRKGVEKEEDLEMVKIAIEKKCDTCLGDTCVFTVCSLYPIRNKKL